MSTVISRDRLLPAIKRGRPWPFDAGSVTLSRRNASAIDAFPAAAARPRALAGKRRFRHKVAARIGALYLPNAARSSHLRRVDLRTLHASADEVVNCRFVDRSTANAIVLYQIYATTI